MRDNSNLPPGVSEWMIPGNEPDIPDDYEEVVGYCSLCGREQDEHTVVQRTDAEGNDYEDYDCPKTLSCADTADCWQFEDCPSPPPGSCSLSGHEDVRWTRCKVCGELYPLSTVTGRMLSVVFYE